MTIGMAMMLGAPSDGSTGDDAAGPSNPRKREADSLDTSIARDILTHESDTLSTLKAAMTQVAGADGTLVRSAAITALVHQLGYVRVLDAHVKGVNAVLHHLMKLAD